MVRSLFQEAKVWLSNTDSLRPMMRLNERGKPMDFTIIHTMTAGAYKMMHQECYLPVDPDGKAIPHEETVQDPRLVRLSKAAKACGVPACTIYGKLGEHGSTDAPFKTVEERDAACIKGETLIRKLIKQIPIRELQDALDDYYVYIAEMQEKYPRLKGIY